MKKLSKTEAGLKKNVAYKKRVYSNLLRVVEYTTHLGLINFNIQRKSMQYLLITENSYSFLNFQFLLLLFSSFINIYLTYKYISVKWKNCLLIEKLFTDRRKPI